MSIKNAYKWHARKHQAFLRLGDANTCLNMCHRCWLLWSRQSCLTGKSPPFTFMDIGFFSRELQRNLLFYARRTWLRPSKPFCIEKNWLVGLLTGTSWDWCICPLRTWKWLTWRQSGQTCKNEENKVTLCDVRSSCNAQRSKKVTALRSSNLCSDIHKYRPLSSCHALPTDRRNKALECWLTTLDAFPAIRSHAWNK